jgi:hypothetical protein
LLPFNAWCMNRKVRSVRLNSLLQLLGVEAAVIHFSWRTSIRE